jgi:hypothetical protein
MPTDKPNAAALDVVAAFTANERANLAMFCYRKSHLRRIDMNLP